MKILIDLGKGRRPMCMDCAADFVERGKLLVEGIIDGDMHVKMAPGVTIEELRDMALTRHGE